MSFCVRYFGGHVTMFREFTTQKLFFFQARRHVYDGTIQCPKVRVVLGFAQALAFSDPPSMDPAPRCPTALRARALLSVRQER